MNKFKLAKRNRFNQMGGDNKYRTQIITIANFF